MSSSGLIEPIILHPSTVSPDYVKEGSDWLSVFNPQVRRVMDIKLYGRISCENSVIGSIRFSPDGSCIAIGYSGGVTVCNCDGSSKVALSLPSQSQLQDRARVHCVGFSPDSTLLAVASDDKLVRVWRIESKTLLHTLSEHTGDVYALEFTPDGQRLLTASADRTIRVWSLSSSPAQHSTLAIELDMSREKTGVTALSVSPDGCHAAVGSSGGSMRLWDLQTGRSIAEWKAHEDQVYSVSWNYAGLISGGLDRAMKKWSVEFTGQPVVKCERVFAHENYVLSVAAAQHGLMKRAASGSADGKLQLWDLKSGELLFCVMGHRSSVTAVDLSSDGAYIVSGSGDGDTRIWAYTVI